VKEALQRLDDAGHVAYVVGGSVRDFLLGRDTKDHDIATSADPDELVRLFPDSITVGKAFGVVKVPIEGIEYPLEIATFRKDLEYRDHRHPTGVLFAGPEEDARRRDFTINALFYDAKSSRILDTVGGLGDLASGTLRAIGDAQERFKEDALRLLRAVRFTTSLGFVLDPGTIEGIQARSRLVAKVSGERIRDELTLMWKGPRPAEALKLLSQYGLLKPILPEVEAQRGLAQIPSWSGQEGDVFAQSLKTLSWLVRQNPQRDVVLAWGAVLMNIGKPVAAERSGGTNFNGHEIDGARMALRICDRLRLPKADGALIAALVEDQLKFRGVFQMREATLQRFLREPHFDQLLKLHRADATASDGNLAFHEFCATRLEELRNSPDPEASRLISGEDLIELGFRPGPKFSEILRAVEDLALERKLATKDEALEYVVKHFVR
jgi:tRNA nucleotidyltransferase/poly(A) polymerase